MAQHERGRLGGSSTHSASADHGLFFFLTSTLLPITPPRIPPAAAPITPPFTLLRLVVAPMIAPAAAPIAASRLVFFLVTVLDGAGAELTEPLDDDDVVRRAVELDRVDVPVAVRGDVADGAAYPRSAAEMLSSDRAEFA